jgi:Icc-related predicted phosphoesterase
MKLYILSDLHLEFSDFKPKVNNADIVLLAGDIHLGDKGIFWAIENFPNTPVLYVLGNHEFYKKTIPDRIDKLKIKAKGSNVVILENESYQFGNIKFLGCTLWTDLALFEDNAYIGGAAASASMSDYQMIRVSPKYRRLRPEDTIRFHKYSLKWLETEFSNIENNIVVLSHHAPSPKSLNPLFGNIRENAAYASNLEKQIVAWCPKLWIHGHIHYKADYIIGSTRVVCNARGYPEEKNSGFNSEFLINI